MYKIFTCFNITILLMALSFCTFQSLVVNSYTRLYLQRQDLNGVVRLLVLFVSPHTAYFTRIGAIIQRQSLYTHLIRKCVHTTINNEEIFSANSKAFTSELIDDLKKMFSRYYIHSDILSRFKFSITLYYVARRERDTRTHQFSALENIYKKSFLILENQKKTRHYFL